MEKNPWKLISSKDIYKNNWIRVREDNVINPTGGKGVYGVVEVGQSSAIVPLNDKMEIYLVGQWRYIQNKYSWELPVGGFLEGENSLECAKRELREEVSLEADEWISLGAVDESIGVTNTFCNIFIAKSLSFLRGNPDETEILNVRKVPFSKAVDMVMNGEISEAGSVIGILKAKEFLKL